ncbi:MAG: hypothetical protein AB2747_05240 [Candidatus Thiodiazotropha taylori]
MKKTTAITQFVEVEVDETKFTPEFMAEFSKVFYPFETIEEHMLHIGQLEARGMLLPVTEGYGDIKELGIKATVIGGKDSISLERDEASNPIH